MKIRLKAPHGRTTTGIYGAEGKEYEVGTELTVKEEPTKWRGRYDIVSDEKGKEPVVNPDNTEPPKTGYAIAEQSAGWYAVTKDGAVVTKNMRKGDLEGFDAMSDDDKDAFVELHKPE
ncbi:hypothetical protein [Martelella limonii]|uniref:hypothetical protein n=1 Tax=Martelella limonii TaxID=1647649 RepID=UPI0015807DB8|nr:hypothetical protein [Martelella limonii]